MAVITMPVIAQLLIKLKKDYPEIIFKPAAGSFAWSPAEMTISLPSLSSRQDAWLLLHELAHARLKHADYHQDIELIKKELLAWEYAKKRLAPRYGQVIDEAYVDGSLETYRQWLHRRSLCPKCRQNGLQQTSGTYLCLNCGQRWRSNEAKLCRLKRTTVKG